MAQTKKTKTAHSASAARQPIRRSFKKAKAATSLPRDARREPRETRDRWPLLTFIRRYYHLLVVALIGVIIGVLGLASVRFLAVHPSETHYHANFAVYINGQREQFKSFTYYEEVAACTSAYADNPKGRVHMHDNVNDVIHVHDKRVTWGDFFSNIDWSLGKNFLQTDSGIYQSGDGNVLVFILNGERMTRVDNKLIGDQDKLLVSYGPEDADFTAQFNGIQNKAAVVDTQQDPASCSGLNGPAENSVGERLRRALYK